MAYLDEFWLILERNLILAYSREKTITENTKDYILTNTFGLTEFGYVMKKL